MDISNPLTHYSSNLTHSLNLFIMENLIKHNIENDIYPFVIIQNSTL